MVRKDRPMGKMHEEVKKWLTRPADRACPVVGRMLLERVERARPRLNDPADAEALHDFRVATRRLRSFLRSYRPHLPTKLGGKLRKQLGEVFSSTNAARDAEVHRAWLEKQLAEAELPHDERRALALLAERLAPDSPAPLAELRRQAGEGFARVADKLRKQFDKAAGDAGADRSPPFAQAAAAELRKQAERLGEQLGQVQSALDPEDHAHEARLRGKRVRYLIEPLIGVVDGAEACAARLKQLQDLLGDWHDLRTLQAELRERVRESAVAWADELVSKAAAKSAGDQTLRGPELARQLAPAAGPIRAGQEACYDRLCRQREAGEIAALLEDLENLAGRLEQAG
ncbi:MAG: CHAD domain-containing protein [Phycisphaeraceae bacterium]